MKGFFEFKVIINVFDVDPALYKCSTNVLCLQGLEFKMYALSCAPASVHVFSVPTQCSRPLNIIYSRVLHVGSRRLVLCSGMLCHAMPCHTMPCHAMPCHAMPCHAMSCHARPCSSILGVLIANKKMSIPCPFVNIQYCGVSEPVQH